MPIFPITQVPSTISGLTAWLDSNDSSTVIQSGGAVSQWNDKSGRKNNAAQGTGANQPTYTQNLLVGYPGIVFDGTNDYLEIPSTISLEPNFGGFTIFLVIRYATTGLVCKISKGNNVSTDIGYAWVSTSLRLRSDTSVNATSTGGFNSTAFNVTPYVVTWVFTGSDCNYFNNNASAGAGTDSYSGAVTGGVFTFRIARGNGASSTVNQQTFEIICYKKELSSAEQTIVCRYLSNKWSAIVP